MFVALLSSVNGQSYQVQLLCLYYLCSNIEQEMQKIFLRAHIPNIEAQLQCFGLSKSFLHRFSRLFFYCISFRFSRLHDLAACTILHDFETCFTLNMRAMN